MKKRNRIAALLLAVLLLVSCLSACSSATGKIKDTLKEFEYACRNLDLDAMLGCIDPNVADPIRMLLALYSDATGQDYEDVTDDILEDIVYSVFGTDYDPDDFLSTLSVTDAKLDVSDGTAYVNCVVHFEIAGEKFARNSEIVMIEVRDKWYIAYFDLFA